MFIYSGKSPQRNHINILPAPINAIINGRRFPIWGSDPKNPLTANRSMLFAFNQLLALYLATFVDSATSKIYRALIDGFANGAFSRAVMSEGNPLPDLVNNNAAIEFGIRGDPLPGGILCQSLGLILRRLVVDMNQSTQISDHLVATLSDIPLYVRESFRANLPVFIKLFEQVQKAGEFYKQLMTQTSIQVGRPYGPAQAATDQLAGGATLDAEARIFYSSGVQYTLTDTGIYTNASLGNSVGTIADAAKDSAPMALKLSSIIDGIAAGCYSIANAAAEVLRELADEPLYLQTHENSIQEYQTRYGKMPLMPISLALTYLRPTTDASMMLPFHSVGDETFKLMYGTRKLIGRPASKFTLADAPGVRANLDAYNASAGEREKIDRARYERFIGNAAAALRLVVDTRYCRGAVASAGDPGDFVRLAYVQDSLTPGGGGGPIDPHIAIDNKNAAYSARTTTGPQMTLAVAESSYQDEQMRAIVSFAGAGVKATTGTARQSEWIYNIIDMNIIPINVHALMRDIPLAPLYNYAYTFEQMACMMYGTTVEKISGVDLATSNLANTREAFLKLLIDPYTAVGQPEYGFPNQTTHSASNAVIQRLFRGDDSLMMGRPKYLSDQIYNKVLFGSLIPTPYDFDETGPPGAGRMETGYRLKSAVDASGNAVPTYAINGTMRTSKNPVTADHREVLASSSKYNYFALTYIGKPDGAGARSAFKAVTVPAAATAIPHLVDVVGKARFDTRIVRNQIFLANVQRLLRLKLGRELTQYRNVLVSNQSVVDLGVTEYGALPASQFAVPNEYGSANETAIDRRYDNESRLGL